MCVGSNPTYMRAHLDTWVACCDQLGIQTRATQAPSHGERARALLFSGILSSSQSLYVLDDTIYFRFTRLTLKEIDFKILGELMKDAKITDRKLSKNIGVSQPTVTRRRAKLEHELAINYVAVPDFTKVGYEILAISIVKYGAKLRAQLLKRDNQTAKMIQATLEKTPSMFFASSGRGLEYDGVSISFHKNYNEFVTFRRELEGDWGDHSLQINSFVVSLLSDNILRNFNFKPYGESIKTSQ